MSETLGDGVSAPPIPLHLDGSGRQEYSTGSAVALFGAGSIGTIEAKAWRKALGSEGRLIIVDRDPAKKALASELHADFLNVDVASPDAGGVLGNLARTAGTWSISTNTDTHALMLRAALGNGVRKIFLEKPSTENPAGTARLLAEHPGTLVQVDYVECGHPAVLAAVNAMWLAGFEPAEFFNWRGKDLRGAKNRGIGGGLGSRITLEDLVHDISEIDYVSRELTGKSLADSKPTVTSAEIRSWSELDRDKFPFSSDVSARFTLETETGVKAEVRGAFDEPERRYFVVANEGGSAAYFVNTLGRPHIQPVAALIEGKENVELLFSRAREGGILNDADVEKLFIETRAKRLDLSAHSDKSPIERMVSNLFEAKKEGDLICPAWRAVAIERVAEAVYVKAGRRDAMEFRDLSLMKPPEPVADVKKKVK